MADKAAPAVEMPTKYDPHAIERKWYQFWEEQGLFRPEVSSKYTGADANKADPFVVVIPPPNVTGSLHMGHALNTRCRTSSCAGGACKGG
jgi:Valyl-tRNA synthetase